MAPASSSATTTSVQVALRIRPTTTQDTHSIPTRFQRAVVHPVSSNAVSVDPVSAAAAAAGGTPPATATPGKKQTFTFDHVLPPETTQYDMFTATAQSLISRFLDGFNCTILAYGQTSSGKTFTMTGIDLDANPADPDNGMGIIPRSVSTIFQRAKQLRDERGGAWTYSIKGSFLELYNEDLIDLLAMDDGAGGRKEVQIREDKSGHIIWEGLREIPVRSAGEVMSLIRKGTAIRRTNETDMNAQSSRSHAIFSLTLTQKKFTGSGPPPRSSSPGPSTRSPSRLVRPGSVFGSPASPSSRLSMPPRPGTPSSARNSLRPGSSLGMRSEVIAEDEAGEWVTVVSKFHFVDLAGSERLKRTAAQGERVKEGISINSGLLALGNVISALGDPARAKTGTASYVPYRDSKLTRLLQDSLGGNAHTLMIACISPAEWNAAETVNTLKYANRARNIKNRAVVNQREEGWEDVEWLQGMVTRLRKELKGLKEGGAGAGHGALSASGSLGSTAAPSEGASKRVLQQMVELQNNYEDLRAKFVERTEELTRLRGELAEKQRSSSMAGGTARYEEIVGPVIEEYEKTISAMEAEISLNRAALRHTNELVEEKEEELAAIQERHASTELYVEELKGRVAKLGEREASTEAYVRDLEEKIKLYDESSVTSSSSIVDLKRELSRFKDTDSHSAQYIAELEARLARADESILALQQTVDRLEKESERRHAEVEALQARLSSLMQDGESWRSDLERREQRVKELEAKMEEWEQKRRDAGEERERLGVVVDGVEQAKRELESSASRPGTPTSNGINGVHLDADSSAAPSPVPESASNLALETQLAALQETHAATLADLSSVTSKYRDALREISDLAAQIEEVKLSSPDMASPPERPMELMSPGGRRRMGGDGSKGRFFFRQAASTESLHSRSLSQSVSLSQELSSAHSHKMSYSSGTSSPGTSSPRVRPNLSISLTHNQLGGERSVSSLEKEIMRLQEVLKDREAEISVLEQSLKESQRPGEHLPTHDGLLSPPESNAGELPRLSPNTTRQFDAIRETMHHVRADSESVSSVSEVDENLERLNELMRSMAQKESQHRETVDDLTSQLAQVRRQHDELVTLSRDQAINMSSELEGLRSQHEVTVASLAALEKHEAELLSALEQIQAHHAASVDALRSEHEEALRRKEAEVDALIARLKEDHQHMLEVNEARLAEASSALERAHKEHTEAFGSLKAQHEAELKRRSIEVEDLLARSRAEHEAALAKATSEHEKALKLKDEQTTESVQRTEEEFYNALTKLREDHAQRIEQHAAESAQTLERLREEHDTALRVAELSRNASISASESAQYDTLKALQDEHSTLLSKKEAAYTLDLQRAQNEHSRALAAKDEAHETALARLRNEHASVLSKAQADASRELEDLRAALAQSEQSHAASTSQARRDHDNEMQALRERQALILQEVERGHEQDVATLKSSHEAAISESKKQLKDLEASLALAHAQELSKLRTEHQQALAEVNARLVAVQEQHLQDLEASRTQSESHAVDERERLQRVMSEMEEKHSQERDVLRKDHDLLVEQITLHQASAEKAMEQRDVLQSKLTTLTQELAVLRANTDAHAHDHGSLQSQFAAVSAELATAKALAERHMSERDALQEQLDTAIQEAASHKSQLDAHVQDLDALRQLHASVSGELASHKASSDELAHAQASHESALSEKADVIDSLKQELGASADAKAGLESELASLRAELESMRSQQAKLAEDTSADAARQSALLADAQAQLARAREERDALSAERAKQDAALRDLESRLARSPSPPSVRTRSIPAAKLPPLSLPPPTPPPAPPEVPPAVGSAPSQASSGARSSRSSHDSHYETPATSVAPSSLAHSTLPAPPAPADAQLAERVREQASVIEEKDTMIKTLNKQLSHCETDLQAHMDLVNTLETSLADAEKNLRKARMQATELARERDTLTGQVDGLRRELTETKREVASVRQSVVEEKLSLESRLDEERRAKERARAQLDSRMNEVTKRKSKFACL